MERFKFLKSTKTIDKENEYVFYTIFNIYTCSLQIASIDRKQQIRCLFPIKNLHKFSLLNKNTI